MNIEDFKPMEISLEEIFIRQKEIKFMYEPSARDLFDNFDIDTYEDQEIFKKYCWRITEELMEALEDRNNFNHFREELIDGFNFMIELYLLYGWGFHEVIPVYAYNNLVKPSSVETAILGVVYQLGITANILKNRQWRQSQYLVDLLIFEKRLKEIWIRYMQIFKILGMTPTDVLNLWSLKYQVNKFRIESNY